METLPRNGEDKVASQHGVQSVKASPRSSIPLHRWSILLFVCKQGGLFSGAAEVENLYNLFLVFKNFPSNIKYVNVTYTTVQLS